jgi:hypothetical protein
MATYLQGVTDFIPDYQPFQPDLNFYGNLLQTKQTQYDTNWKQLNNLYGQLYGADLTHDMNLKKKDELLKQIDFNLKRVSGLDLSLEQNVNQAMQVFRPFYEDKYLMKDMAWTKNWKNTYESANALKNSQDEKQRKQWWSTGIQGLELRKQMFKDATLDETLNMANAKYTANVNDFQEYLDLAKKYNIGAVVQEPDKSGLYFVRKKNGELILPTLQQMFLAEYANRPDIQDKYREEAFVERMNYAYQNKEKFGSTLEAEKDYIKQKYDYIKKYAEQKDGKAQDELNTTQNLIGNLEKNVNSGNVNPQQKSYYERLTESLQVNATIAQNTSNLNNQINDKKAAGEEGPDDILSDIELARLKVDAGYAAIAAEQKIMGAANAYAFANYEVEYKANPVGLEFLRHKHASQRQQQAHRNREEELRLQHEQRMFEKAADHNVSLGYWSYDQNGRLITNPQANGFNLDFTVPGGTGSETEGKFTFDELQRISRNQMLSGAVEGGNHLMKTIQNGITTGSFSASQLAQLILNFNPSHKVANKIIDAGKAGSTDANKKLMKEAWNGIWTEYKKDNNSFIKKMADSGQLWEVNSYMQSWASLKQGDPLSKVYSNDPAIYNLQQLKRVDDALLQIRNQNYDNIRAKFKKDLNHIVSKVKAKDPETYKNVTQEKIDQAVDLMMNRYVLDGNGHTEEFYKIADQVDRQIGKILGFNISKTTNRPATLKWYNYVFPITNIGKIFGDGREDVHETASWVRDVFDKSFDELTNMDPEKGGLYSYIPGTSSKKGKDNIYGLKSETGMMQVAPGVNWDPGNQSASSMFNTVLSTIWNRDNSQYRITTKGNQKPANSDDPTGIEQSEALAIVAELKNQLNTNKELKPFFIGATTISMENEKLGSMKLMAPREVIEKVIKSMAGDDVKENDIKAKIDKIYQNGITFIAPKDTWAGNKLYNKQFPTPMETLLNQKSYEYNDPNGTGNYRIEKVPGSGDYIASGTTYELRPDGSKVEHKFQWDLNSRSGKKIDAKDEETFGMFQKLTSLNFDTYRKIHQSGNKNLIEKANTNFGGTVNNPFWRWK